MSYSGSYDLTVDPKGRMVIPAIFRERFRDGGQVAIRRGAPEADGSAKSYVAVYDRDSWNDHMVKLRRLRDEERIPRPVFDTLTAWSTPINPDTQGRFGVPQEYRNVAEISSSVVMIGTDDHLKIYAPSNAPAPVGADFDAVMDVFNGLPL